MTRLEEERRNASIDSASVKELWFGGKQNVFDRQRAALLLERDPILTPKVSSLHLTQGELRRRGMEQIGRIIQLTQAVKDDPGLLNALNELLMLVAHSTFHNDITTNI
jgi:hypothetical protein